MGISQFIFQGKRVVSIDSKIQVYNTPLNYSYNFEGKLTVVHIRDSKSSFGFIIIPEEAMAASMILQVVVSPLLGVVFDNLSILIKKGVNRQWGIGKEMQKLSSTLSTIQAVVADAEEKQVTNKAIATWLGKLKEAAYAGDDILDEWAAEALGLEMEGEHETDTKQVCGSFLSCFNVEQIRFRHKIAKRVNELIVRFDEIADERTKFHLREGTVETKLDPCWNRETSSSPTEEKIYGRHEETEAIVGLLLDNGNGDEHISICPILGIGGLGKTTVAQGVYNDERVAKRFDVRIWVCVSEDFDVKRLTRAVLESVSGVASTNTEALDPLQRSLQEKLAGKRFLLVLDDVWNENQEEWNRFKSSLRSGAQGSSVIVTTRLNTVASITGTCPPFQLTLLSEDDCWSLFKQRAFGPGKEEKPELVKIGKDIVKKCGGVPLAARALGGLMRFRDEESEWLYVRDSEIWELPQSNENSILPALRLSYTHLPQHLRQCFAYCSIFPKDYRMNRETVIHLWIANGFIQVRERMEMEDVGNEIFNGLLWRSLFQDAIKNEEGRMETFMMHDLVHDLACSVSMNECWLLDDESQVKNVPKNTRHLSLHFNMTAPPPSLIQSIYHSAPNLRTLMLLGRYLPKFPFQFVLSSFKYLRALSLEYAGGVKHADSLGNLKHLRYLNLGGTTSLPDSIGKLRHLRYLGLGEARSLPESICQLRNLQTLKIHNDFQPNTLPNLMMKMSSLRHLEIGDGLRSTQMPIRMGQLTGLQTLSSFVVSSDDGRSIKELKDMNHLRGCLILRALENVTSLADAKEANLMRKQSLHTLQLTWSDSHLEDKNDRDVAEGLQPHPNIKRLNICGYQGLILPSWVSVSSLPNLVEVSLSCRRCEQLPSLGKLPMLKKLEIYSMDHLKYFNSDVYMVNGFPSLVTLHISDMPKLEDWSCKGEDEQAVMFPVIKKLCVSSWPQLKRLPTSQSLERLRLQVNHEMVLLNAMQNVTVLQTLEIDGYVKLRTLPKELGNLSELIVLVVSNCKELVCLPDELGNLSSLRSLEVSYCDALISLPKLGRGSLVSLTIRSCPKLDLSTVGFHHLVALSHLEIGGSTHFCSLPDGIQLVSSTLQNLCVSDLSSLVCLPDWMERLTKLESLRIYDCHPELHQRCKTDTGEDWPKIAHIANVANWIVGKNATERSLMPSTLTTLLYRHFPRNNCCTR